MPTVKRIKTAFPGVFYLEGKKSGYEGKERVFYIRYRANGRQFEEKVGRSVRDNMTAEKAFKLRESKLTNRKIFKNKLKDTGEIESSGTVNYKNPKTQKSSISYLIDPGYSKNEKNLFEILDALLRSSSDGIYITDNKGKTIACNEASIKLSGLQFEEVVGRNVAEFVESGLIDRSVSLEVIKKKRKVSLIQYPQKTNKQILTTGTPVLDNSGNIRLVILTERDITQLNKLKEKLAETKQITEKLKRALS